ncbi:MAG: 1,4-dihydroxy-2-naphthoate polyprenyltransferase [Candidatus Omnitrophica bacterium CG12_big_fil_rev_8_21_14_0_65_50_5]|nr:MAG: 1,4-dihydroxy-2-naphthoate polyprenyltransferase [Candidatus Omnitrophica bacterium CG12_big_fil_rev_8_21_14_0_65_50_5]
MTIENWFFAIRPKTLTAAVAPVIIGAAMAFDEGRAHWLSAMLCLLGAVLIQIGTNLANDYFDYVKGTDTSERIGPVRVTQAGLISPDVVKKSFIIVFALAAVIGGLLALRGGWPIVVIAVLSVMSGILYTAGPKPLGYLGLGEIFVLIFFGPVAVGGTYYVQTLEIHAPVLIAGLAPGFLSVAILAVNNLRDIDGDRKSGKRTLAVRFGDMFGRWEYFVSMILAALIPAALMLMTQSHVWVVFSSVAIMILSRRLIQDVTLKSDGATLNGVLAQTGQLLLIYAVIFSAGWMA